MATKTVREVPKMDPKVKKKWLAALLSGDFKKTEGKLVRKKGTVAPHDMTVPEMPYTGYCCLGVLCQVVDPKLRITGKSMPTREFMKSVGLDKDFADLLAGVNDAGRGEQFIKSTKTQVTVHGKNPPKGFRRVARLIEKYL